MQILQNIAHSNSTISIVTTINKGQGHARNVGLNHATGDYIVFLDADDELSLDLLSDNLCYLENEAFEFVQFPITYKANTSDSINHKPKSDIIYENKLVLDSVFKEKSITWLVCGKFFRRDFIKHFTFREDIFYEDNELMLRVFMKVEKCCISESGIYLYNYYSNSNSNSTIDLLKKQIDTFNIVNQTLYFIEQSRLTKKILVDYYARLINIRKSILKLDASYPFKDVFKPHKINFIDILGANIPIKERLKVFFHVLFV